MPKGSERLGTMTASQDLNKAFMSSTPLWAPLANTTAWDTPSSTARSSRLFFKWPSPAKTKQASGLACRTKGIASRSKSGPLCDANRPTNKNMGANGSMPLLFFVSPESSGDHSKPAIASAWMPVGTVRILVSSAICKDRTSSATAPDRTTTQFAASQACFSSPRILDVWSPAPRNCVVPSPRLISVECRVMTRCLSLASLRPAPTACRMATSAGPTNHSCPWTTSKAPRFASQSCTADTALLQKVSTCQTKSGCTGDATSW
mmetsp:Transcript_48678/g.141963  ORF Transcript_48678/g.141963 Transcript_48678/m.141963 type:complete len:262 (+) Transcript_48678:571-1356(+)